MKTELISINNIASNLRRRLQLVIKAIELVVLKEIEQTGKEQRLREDLTIISEQLKQEDLTVDELQNLLEYSKLTVRMQGNKDSAE